jgi:hypothetical protein
MNANPASSKSLRLSKYLALLTSGMGVVGVMLILVGLGIGMGGSPRDGQTMAGVGAALMYLMPVAALASAYFAVAAWRSGEGFPKWLPLMALLFTGGSGLFLLFLLGVIGGGPRVLP